MASRAGRPRREAGQQLGFAHPFPQLANSCHNNKKKRDREI